ncbi:hypothetical protein CRG98_032560, partial [Punica granatum]
VLRAKVWQVPISVRQRDPDLDHLQLVDVGLEAEVRAARVEGFREDYDTGELRVHGDDGIIVYQRSDELKLIVEVITPDRTDHDRAVESSHAVQ